MDLKTFIDRLTASQLETTEQTKRVESWRSWYDGYVQNFHSYTVYNGTNSIRKKMNTLHMAKVVCEDWANLLFNEKCMISTDSEDATDKLAKALKDINFTTQINKGIELGMALGTVGYVLRLTESRKLSLEQVTADQIFPLTVENGRCVECAFISKKTINAKPVAYISIHQKGEDDNYVIENALYSYENGQIGDMLEYWVWKTGSEIPWFALFSPNAVNNFDLSSPYGISVFANCISVLKSIDTEFDAILNEVIMGRMKLVTSTEALSYYSEQGVEKPVFDPMDSLIMRLPKGINDAPIIECIAPTLRTADQIAALNQSLKHLSAKVGMGDNRYSFDGATGLVKTATEVISNNAPLYRRLKKHEMVLEDALNTLIRSIADIHTRFMQDSIVFEELNISFDDSIVQDKDAERAQDTKDVNLGVMSKVEYRMKWYGEDEETARRAVEEASGNNDYNTEDNF